MASSTLFGNKLYTCFISANFWKDFHVSIDVGPMTPESIITAAPLYLLKTSSSQISCIWIFLGTGCISTLVSRAMKNQEWRSGRVFVL
jgi:hypothetical protein